MPIHSLHSALGHSITDVLPALHSLTGCDITSKIGTKKAAIKAEPQNFLRHFGKSPATLPSLMNDAEQYLMKVINRKSQAKTFTELRKEIYHFSKSIFHQNLPPTSEGLQTHLLRSF